MEKTNQGRWFEHCEAKTPPKDFVDKLLCFRVEVSPKVGMTNMVTTLKVSINKTQRPVN